MKNTIRILLPALLCVALCLCLAPGAFADNGSGYFFIPQGTAGIEEGAFANNYSMTSLVIPVGVRSIGYGAFDGCYNLTEVYYAGTEAQWNQVQIAAGNDPLWGANILFLNGQYGVPITETTFPDTTFRNYIYNNFDTDKTGILSPAEIQAVSRIECHHMGISSLKGVEVFSELSYLDCGFNNLSELDVSKNTKLQTLGIASNSISYLDLSHNQYLQTLATGTELQDSDGTWRTYGNPLGWLDVSNNRALRYLECPGNGLSTLDVSNNTELEVLRCWSNNLSSLDLSRNTKLLRLACSSNPISYLDVSYNPDLVSLVFQHCNISALNLGSKAKLEVFRGNNNNLTSLDLSNLTALQRMECAHNTLTSVSLSGCSSLETLNLCYNKLSYLNTTGCNALVFADLGANQLTSVSFAGFRNLQYLCIAENNIESLDLRNCSGLVELNAGKGALRNLNLAGCSSLQYLGCWRNNLTSVDLRGNTALKHVNLSANKTLTSVSLGSLQNLEMLWLQNTNLRNVNIRNCPIIVNAFRNGTVIDFGVNGRGRDNGDWVGYLLASQGLNPGSSDELDHCAFCVDKNVSVTA